MEKQRTSSKAGDLKTLFWGTSEFAIPSLRVLVKNGYQVTAVVTNPDKPVGRKQTLTPSSVKLLAKKYKIPVFQPENLKDDNFKKELPETDLFVIAAYGKIIPKEILELPKFGAINLHPSLLPRWRGPSPIQYAILHGDKEVGVTIMKMDERMDHGPVIVASNFQLSASSRPVYRELHDKLAELGADLLMEALPKYIRGEIAPEPQNDAKATYSKILKKDDGRIDWKKPAEGIERMVRAFNPRPGTWTIWPSDKKIYRIRIAKSDFTEEEPAAGFPGYVWQDKKTPLLVKTGKGSLIIRSLTLEGKKPLSAESFIKGYPQIVGTTLV